MESLLAGLPEGVLTRPVALSEDCGEVHQEVAASSPRAQAFYDQGTACLGTFDWLQAARSFHAALGEDPGLGAAYTGLARAYLAMEEPEQALSLAQKGRELASAPYDRAWAELGALQLEAVLASPKELKGALAAYRNALDRFAAQHPQDPHGLALRDHGESRADDWGQGGGEAAVPWYEKALEADPSYFPAQHFLAHAFENQGLYPPAVEHARRFSEMAPQAPHAHHMVAHTAPRLGLWGEALAALEAADRLHLRRFETDGLPAEADWHYAHNLRLMAAVALHQGEGDRARNAYRQAFELTVQGARGGFYCGPWIEFLLLQGESENALAAADTCLSRPSNLAQVLGHTYRGEALLDLGRSSEARAETRAARTALQRFLESVGPVSTERILASTARRGLAILEGKLAILDGDRQPAETLLAALGEDLAAGHTFDAWATAQARLEELSTWADRHATPDLSHRLHASLTTLEASLARPDPAGGGSPAGCH